MVGLIDDTHGMVDHRQGLEAKEVELDQPDFLDVTHGILSDDFVVRAFVQRDVVSEGFLRNHHASCMGGGVPRQPFQGSGHLHEFADLGIGFRLLTQARLLSERLV